MTFGIIIIAPNGNGPNKYKITYKGKAMLMQVDISQPFSFTLDINH